MQVGVNSEKIESRDLAAIRPVLFESYHLSASQTLLPTMEWRLNIIALILLLLISIVAFLLLSDQFIAPKHHPQEPPLVPQRIPYVGHVAGLFLHGMKYFEFTRYKNAIRYTMDQY